jgi:hypothetical protein
VELMDAITTTPPAPLPLLWFTWRQNNSGGKWHLNRHIAHYVSVQHTSFSEARDVIEQYFDERGSCPCCGDRWDADSYEDGTVPIYYAQPLYEILQGPGATFFHYEARLHCYDGRILTLTRNGIADDPKLTEEWKRLKENPAP